MNTKTLSNRALSVIDQYNHFTVGTSVCRVPYYNNKVARSRGTLRTYVGKGSPKDIFEEVDSIMNKSHFPVEQLADETLKKILVDHNIGIDCSGFAYYVLNAECLESNKGSIDKHLKFVNCSGIISKIRCSLRPAENCDVATFADDRNSRLVTLGEVTPGDMITMTGDNDDSERDHILVIHQIDYQNFFPTKIHYSHSVAYPEDGVSNTGVRQGSIEILDPQKGFLEARWIEDGKEGPTNRLFIRAQKSKTELRRLKWL
ncbi:MAG: hypothetical protein WCP09_01705 [Candidatus Taylorbacteria bacterium]